MISLLSTFEWFLGGGGVLEAVLLYVYFDETQSSMGPDISKLCTAAAKTQFTHKKSRGDGGLVSQVKKLELNDNTGSSF